MAQSNQGLAARSWTTPLVKPELQRLKDAYIMDTDSHWGGVCVGALDEVMAALVALPTDAECHRCLRYVDDAMAAIRKRLRPLVSREADPVVSTIARLQPMETAFPVGPIVGQQ